MFKGIAMRMPGSIIEYSPTTTTPTLDVHFIASQAAPPNSSSSDHSQLLFSLCVACYT